MSSSSSSSSWSNGSSSEDDPNTKRNKETKAQKKMSAQKGQTSKETAYARVEQAKKQSEKSKVGGGGGAKPKTPSPAQEKGQTSKETAYARVEAIKNNKETPKQGKLQQQKEKEEKNNNDRKEEEKSNNDRKEEDTVFVTEPQTPVDETGKKAFVIPPAKPVTEGPDSASSSGGAGAGFDSSISSSFDEDLAKLEQQSRNLSTGDDFDHLTDRQFSTQSQLDRDVMLMSGERDSGALSGSTTSTNMHGVSSSSISSSMVEVSTPSSARDAMFVSTSSAFDEIQQGEEEDGSSSSSSDGEGKPLSECHVEDDADTHDENEVACGGMIGFLKNYWCSFMFSPIVLGSLLVVGRCVVTGKRWW